MLIEINNDYVVFYQFWVPMCKIVIMILQNRKIHSLKISTIDIECASYVPSLMSLTVLTFQARTVLGKIATGLQTQDIYIHE